MLLPTRLSAILLCLKAPPNLLFLKYKPRKRPRPQRPMRTMTHTTVVVTLFDTSSVSICLGFNGGILDFLYSHRSPLKSLRQAHETAPSEVQTQVPPFKHFQLRHRFGFSQRAPALCFGQMHRAANLAPLDLSVRLTGVATQIPPFLQCILEQGFFDGLLMLTPQLGPAKLAEQLQISLPSSRTQLFPFRHSV